MSGERDGLSAGPPPTSVELPVACSLEAGAGAERLTRWRALHERTEPTVRREGDRLVLRYPRAPGIPRELEELVAAERECCAFADWHISGEERGMQLEIRADHDGLDAIAALLAGQ